MWLLSRVPSPNPAEVRGGFRWQVRESWPMFRGVSGFWWFKRKGVDATFEPFSRSQQEEMIWFAPRKRLLDIGVLANRKYYFTKKSWTWSSQYKIYGGIKAHRTCWLPSEMNEHVWAQLLFYVFFLNFFFNNQCLSQLLYPQRLIHFVNFLLCFK